MSFKGRGYSDGTLRATYLYRSSSSRSQLQVGQTPGFDNKGLDGRLVGP
jgi:hypothetical protein